MTRLALAALLALSIAACGSEDESGGDAGADGPATSLDVRITAGGEGDWTLTSDPAGGDHPDPAAACAALAEHPDALEPVAADAVCTEQYGGPQEAVVSGTIDGETYSGTFTRRNGCEIARWEALQPLLVVRGGA